MTAFPTAQRVIDVALSQVGVTENPPGTNQVIYGKDYGWPGVAWCGQYVWWCYWKAGIDLKANGIPHPQFTPSFWNEARAAGWVVHADDNIQRGDVLFFDFMSPFNTSGIQHTGFALAKPSGGYVATVEGNTSSGTAGSQDNGGGVFKRTRSLAVIVAAVRPPYGQGDDMPLTDTDADLVIDRLLQRAVHTGAGDKTVAAMLAEAAIFANNARLNTDSLETTVAGLAPALTAALTAAIKTTPVGTTGTLNDATIAKLAQAVATELATRLVR